MANESKTPEEHVAGALDLMVQAGWVRQYARNVKTGIAIDWTDKGKQEIQDVWDSMDEFPDSLSPQVVEKLGQNILPAEIVAAIRTIATIGRSS
jgi:hypothetical protein